MEVRGVPPDFIIDQSTRRKIFFDEETDEPLLLTTDSRGKLRIPGTKPLSQVIRNSSNTFVDFIERCLDWDPQTRITPYEALLHDWIIEGLPPKVLLHHKRMLGLQDGNSYRTSTSTSAAALPNINGGNYMRQVGGMPMKQGASGKEKLLNRTCVVSDVLKEVAEEQDSYAKGKQMLNKTGIIVIKDKVDLLQMEQKKQIPPASKNTHEVVDFFGDKEKSKTTNMADLLHEIKKTNDSAQGGGSGLGKIKFDNTYDLSKLKKGSFLSQQSKRCNNTNIYRCCLNVWQ